MRLPKNFPNLRDKHYILAPPVFVQLVVLLFVYILEAILLFAVIHIYSKNVPTPIWVKFILWAMLISYSFVLSRKEFYQRWVNFACDSEACYFRNSFGLWHGLFPKWKDSFIRVPWSLIGEVQLAPRYYDGDGYFPSVIIEIKMSLPQWQKYCEEQGTSVIFTYQVVETKAGTLNIVLANSFHKIEKIKINIDALKPH